MEHNITDTLIPYGPQPIVSRDLNDLAFPGVVVELTPEQLAHEGLCFEDAISFEDAFAANVEELDDEG